jgi:tetratricopeptide (TPR) repeat protein
LGYSFTGQNVDIDYIMPHCFILDRSAFLDVSFTDLYDDKLTIHEFIVDILKKKNNVLLAYDCLIRKMNYEPFLANNIDNTTVIKPNYNNIEPVVEEKIIIPPPPKPEPIVEEKVIIPPPPKPEPIVEEKVIIPPPPIPEPIVEEKVIIPPLEQQTTEPLKTATPVSENKVSDEEDNNEPGFVFINPPQNDHFVSEIKTEEFHEQKPWIEANIENLEQSSTTEPEFSPEESLIHNQNNNIESETIITNETDPIISNISQNTPKIEKETVPLNSNNETKPIKEEDDSLGFTFSDPKPIYYYHNHEKETTKEEIKDTKISDNLKNSPPKVNVNLSIEDDFDFISDTDFEKIKTQIQNQPFEDILAIKYIKMCFQKQLYDEIEQYALKIPGNIEIAYYRIYALERQGKIDKAFECIIDTDFSMIHENGLLVRFLVLNAKLLMKLNEPNDVIMSLNKALQYSSDDEEVLLTRGIFYISQEQFDKALNDFNKILSKNENNIRALKSKGVALQLMMKFEESNDCFYKIISKEIDNIEAMTEIVKNSFQTRDFTSIIEVLEKYIFLHDNNNDVIFSLAGIYCEINEDEKAIELLNKIMMTDNTYPGASELLFKIKTK